VGIDCAYFLSGSITVIDRYLAPFEQLPKLPWQSWVIVSPVTQLLKNGTVVIDKKPCAESLVLRLITAYKMPEGSKSQVSYRIDDRAGKRIV